MRTTSHTTTRPRSIRFAFVLVALVAVLALVLAACGGDDDDDGGGSGAAATNAEVTIKGFAFTTKPVDAGATVTISNQDSTEHTVTADDGDFDTSIDGGKTATFTAPSESGDYKFHCKIHSNMTGTLTVQ